MINSKHPDNMKTPKPKPAPKPREAKPVTKKGGMVPAGPRSRSRKAM